MKCSGVILIFFCFEKRRLGFISSCLNRPTTWEVDVRNRFDHKTKPPPTHFVFNRFDLNRRGENACGFVLDMFVVFPSSWGHRSRAVDGRLFALMQLRWRWGCRLFRQRADHRPNRAQCFHLLPVSTNQYPQWNSTSKQVCAFVNSSP